MSGPSPLQPTPTDLLFGGMQKLGPGSDADTAAVLDLLPRVPRGVIVDAGCGTGRQTLVLARRLGVRVDAVDVHRPFLDELATRAEAAGLAQLVRTHCLDMARIPERFRAIDLLWCEGAAYHIGFARALELWRPVIGPDGWAVISELSWLRADPPPDVRAYFEAAYPGMRTAEENRGLVEAAGYRVRATHVLPPEAWRDGYYDLLRPRARALLEHAEHAVRDLAAEMLEEIRIFDQAEGSYGYVFWGMQPI